MSSRQNYPPRPFPPFLLHPATVHTSGTAHPSKSPPSLFLTYSPFSSASLNSRQAGSRLMWGSTMVTICTSRGGGGGGVVSMNSSSPQLLCTQPAATAPCSPSCSLQVDPPPPPPPPPKKKTPAAARPLHPRSLPRANAQGVRARLAHLAATRGQVLLHARWRGEVGFVPSEVTLACWCGGGGGGRRTISECRRWASSQVPHAYSWCGGVGVGGRRGGGGGARGASSHACLSAACLP